MQDRRISNEMPLMSTLVKISVVSDIGTIETQNKINEAFDLFKYVIKKFSRFDKNSELSKLNKSAGETFQASDEMIYLMQYALKIASATHGAFDPTIIDLLEIYGYGANVNFDKLENPDLVNEIRQQLLLRKNWRNIEVNTNKHSIFIPKGVKVDFGSFAKGYAIDLAYNFLKQHFKGFIINAGGDIMAYGKKENSEPWNVGLENESKSNRDTTNLYGYIELQNQALTSSGGWSRKIKFFHHLINPRTGLPITETHQVFVIANTAMEADAWATALYIEGKPFKPMSDLAFRIYKSNGDCISNNFDI